MRTFRMGVLLRKPEVLTFRYQHAIFYQLGAWSRWGNTLLAMALRLWPPAGMR